MNESGKESSIGPGASLERENEQFRQGQIVRFVDGASSAGSGERVIKTGQVRQIMDANITVEIDGVLLNVDRKKVYDSEMIDRLLKDREFLAILSKSYPQSFSRE